LRLTSVHALYPPAARSPSMPARQLGHHRAVWSPPAVRRRGWHPVESTADAGSAPLFPRSLPPHLCSISPN
jgi:hypothetical protein